MQKVKTTKCIHFLTESIMNIKVNTVKTKQDGKHEMELNVI